MGCFSTNCAVSKLPIYRHPVVGIPISRNPHVDTRRVACYPDADWQIDGFPFFGVNDEYGRIENFEDGKYHTLNVKKYGKITEDMMTSWSQPDAKNKEATSIMFIHRPIWNELIKRHMGLAKKVYAEALERDNQFKLIEQESYKKTFGKKMKTEEEKKKFQKYLADLIYKVPTFQHDGTGFSYEFAKWCNKNYTPLIKRALIDLLAFSESCWTTHTLFAAPFTIGPQISNWKEEASWTQFVAQFAAAMRKERVDDGCD